MTFYYEVSDMNTGKVLGGGYLSDLDSEAGFVEANTIWERHHPKKQIHVEEITSEDYGNIATQLEGRTAAMVNPDA